MPFLTYNEFAAASQKGGTIREDLLDFIENLSPKDTPLFNNLSSVGVSAGFVEYLEDTLTAAAANAWAEGVAATDVALTSPSRNYSIVQNFQKHFHVSGRQQAVVHAGLSSMVSYQEMKKAKELKTDLELALHRGSAVSGNTDTAPQLAGFLNKLSTNFTNAAGVTLSESVFNDLVTLAYQYPVNLRECYCNMLVKRTINQFSTSVQRFIPAEDRRQLDLIDVYESEMGKIAVIKSRYQFAGTAKTDASNSFLVIDPDYFNVGWLRPIVTQQLGLDGDRIRRMMVGEATLIVRSEKAGVGATNLIANISTV
jgi:hypothetical protein